MGFEESVGETGVWAANTIEKVFWTKAAGHVLECTLELSIQSKSDLGGGK